VELQKVITDRFSHGLTPKGQRPFFSKNIQNYHF
jgi:hypothetical protein